MLKDFFLIVEGQMDQTEAIRHIQYNVQQRLTQKYISYRRVDILIKQTSEQRIICNVDYHDKFSANASLFLCRDIFRDLGDKSNIAVIYEAVFHLLAVLWNLNKWKEADLTKELAKIKKEDFFVMVQHGRPKTSAKSKIRGTFKCELQSFRGDYYLEVHKKGRDTSLIHFFTGTPDIDLFFGFFRECHWKEDDLLVLNDFNEEIFFLFDIVRSEITIEYNPQVSSLEQCMNYLEAFSFKSDFRTRNRLLGLPF